ncbi:MAG: kynureninase, partial [Bdellovibrionota bacterium]
MSREKPSYENSEAFAALMDERDPLRSYRNLFHIPKTKTGEEFIYFSGNSLGLQPRKAREYVDQELMDWAELGVEGHLHARHPWLPYHEFLNEPTARLVGAKPIEVVVMNTLTVNLHLMMVSFYRPKANRIKILIEKGAFPSDQYAVASQAQFHGYNPKDVILEISPREGESTLRTEDIVEAIKRDGKTIALVLLGQVNYLTGQAFELAPIAQAAYDQGALIGVDLAHGAGNLELQLHDWKIDFAVWCSYKYLNAGPGGLSGCFVHEKHSKDSTLPRFAGWWGHDKKVRFQMGSKFDPMPGAAGWQLSNPPILQLA